MTYKNKYQDPQKAEVLKPKVVGTSILGDGCVAKQMVFNQIDVGGLISLLGQLKVRCFGFNMIDICGMIDILLSLAKDTTLW